GSTARRRPAPDHRPRWLATRCRHDIGDSSHMHMYHEHPLCAVEWYATHLGGKVQGGALPRVDFHQAYGPLPWPAERKTGMVREPSGSVRFDDISVSIRPWTGGGLVSTRGRLVYHWALSTSDLTTTVARLKREGVKVLEEIHLWDASRAALIEGPDLVAIE